MKEQEVSNAIVTIQGGPEASPTILGRGPIRIPTAGKIRAGIKVLTKKAAGEPKAKAIYEQGVAAGQSFEQEEIFVLAGRELAQHPHHLRQQFHALGAHAAGDHHLAGEVQPLRPLRGQGADRQIGGPAVGKERVVEILGQQRIQRVEKLGGGQAAPVRVPEGLVAGGAAPAPQPAADDAGAAAPAVPASGQN